MENLKLSTFDVFAYLLPGLVVLLAATLLFSPNLVRLADLAITFQGINVSSGIIAAIIAYVFGGVIDYLGSHLYYGVGCRIWGMPYSKERHSKLTHAQQRALVLHYSPENYAELQTWKLQKRMSANLSFSLVLVFVVSAIHLGKISTIDWVFLGIVSLFSALVLLKRAYAFDTWHYSQLLGTIQVLHLEKRAEIDAQFNEPNT